MRERGNALVELAVVIPLLMLLFLGMIELGRFIFFGIAVGNGAHAGAQFGAQSFLYEQDFTGMQTAAQTDAQNPNLSVTATNYCQCWDGTTGTVVTCTSTCPAGQTLQTWVSVQASGVYSPLFSYPGLPTSWTVTRTANMLVAQ